ncbi:MAG: hypothetical protein H0V17_12170 [Deltaproteobacteria bacterium]|nr:hypothetical protein [Deltaproteobacteria bacterium]
MTPLEARAADCTATPTPACHLAEGKKAIKSDPKRAAAEFLASYKLDERTDTLELYAAALENDQQYALAAETWDRIIKYRDSELTAAKEQKKGAGVINAAQRRVTAAAQVVVKLEGKTAKVRIKLNPGPPPKVTRDGTEVDVTKEVWVKSGSDELVFTFADGSSEKVPVNLKAGENVRIDAPLPKKVAPPKVDPPKVNPVNPTEKPIEANTDPEPKDTSMRPPNEEPLPPVSSEPPPTKTKQRVGIALVGGGVILAGIATTFGVLASNDFDDAKAAGCNDDGECAFGSPGIRLAERSNDRATFSLITGIGAGALIVTGVTLYMLGRKETKRHNNMSLHVGSSSAAFAWRF